MSNFIFQDIVDKKKDNTPIIQQLHDVCNVDSARQRGQAITYFFP
jgi:hypothetical protein